MADACYLTAEKIPEVKAVEGVYPLQPEEYVKAFDCYTDFAKKYSGIIYRTEEDFLRKCADYNADGGKCMAYGKDAVEAYVFYYQTETELICVEAVGEDDTLQKVLTGIFAECEGLSLSVKLAPESQITFDFSKKEVKQKGVMGLTDLQVLLKALELHGKTAFAVEDHVVPENNGCFLLSGEKTEKTPAFPFLREDCCRCWWDTPIWKASDPMCIYMMKRDFRKSTRNYQNVTVILLMNIKNGG